MERLIEYVTHHPLMAAAVVLALVVVVTFESRIPRAVLARLPRGTSSVYESGALVLDIRNRGICRRPREWREAVAVGPDPDRQRGFKR
jgi:hypothetical protein